MEKLINWKYYSVKNPDTINIFENNYDEFDWKLIFSDNKLHIISSFYEDKLVLNVKEYSYYPLSYEEQQKRTHFSNHKDSYNQYYVLLKDKITNIGMVENIDGKISKKYLQAYQLYDDNNIYCLIQDIYPNNDENRINTPINDNPVKFINLGKFSKRSYFKHPVDAMKYEKELLNQRLTNVEEELSTKITQELVEGTNLELKSLENQMDKELSDLKEKSTGYLKLILDSIQDTRNRVEELAKNSKTRHFIFTIGTEEEPATQEEMDETQKSLNQFYSGEDVKIMIVNPRLKILKEEIPNI